jgi:hypothetical protein
LVSAGLKRTVTPKARCERARPGPRRGAERARYCQEITSSETFVPLR